MSLADKSLGKWEVKLIDAGDGSGDGYIEFPKELLEKLDWHEGDVINIDIVNCWRALKFDQPCALNIDQALSC